LRPLLLGCSSSEPNETSEENRDDGNRD